MSLRTSTVHLMEPALLTMGNGALEKILICCLLKEPKYKPLNEYWQGLAENEFHLYEVAFTIPAD